MHPNALRVQSALAALGASSEVRELTASTRTAAEAAAALDAKVAQIAKSLVFVSGTDAVLVIASGRNQVSPEKLEAHLGHPVGRADADAVRRLTGFPIGGVPPVGHAAPVKIVIDRDLLVHKELWAAAGTPHAVFRISPGELLRITGGAVLDVRQE